MVILTNAKNRLFTAVVAAFISLPALASEPHENWQVLPDLPYRVQEIYPTVFNDHIVVGGGLSPDISERNIDVSNRVVAYSIADKQWSEWTPFSTPRHHPQLINVNGRLLSFGGFTLTDAGAWTNSTDVLELVETANGHVWQVISQMPVPLSETLITLNGDNIHLVTGRSPIDASQNGNWRDHIDTDVHMIFDTTSTTWTDGLPAPTERNSACGVHVGNKWFTIGGRTVSGGNEAVNEVYDFERAAWQVLTPMPQAQGGLACAALGDKIYVFGGEFFDNGGGVYSQVWEYSIETDKWQQVSTMPVPRHGLGALTLHDSIVVIAGAAKAGGNETSARMSMFSPN